MKEKIMCPKCGKSDIRKETRNVAIGARIPGGKYPKEEKRIIHICNDCKEEFFEEDLSEKSNQNS